LKGLTTTELLNWSPTPQQSLIGRGLCHILLPETKLIIFGEAETWKSMLTIDIAYKLSTGADWLGYNTAKSLVYLLQTEIPQLQLKRRIVKYIRGNGISLNGATPWLCTEIYTKLDKGWGFGELDKELERVFGSNQEVKPVLIIDPIYAVVSGKLSDSYDMGQFRDRLQALIAKYHLAIILVHHTRKPEHSEGMKFSYGADDMYGDGGWYWWCDSVIRTDIGSKETELMLTFEKLRHNEEDKPKPLLVTVDKSNLRFKIGG